MHRNWERAIFESWTTLHVKNYTEGVPNALSWEWERVADQIPEPPLAPFEVKEQWLPPSFLHLSSSHYVQGWALPLCL